MAEQHDLWLKGIGIDVDSYLTSMPGTEKDSGFRARRGEHERAEPLTGETHVREDGSFTAKGAARRRDDDGELLSGEFEIGEDGLTGKGAIAKSTSRDGASTLTVGEIEITSQKRAVTGAKREVDFNKASGGFLPDNVVAKGDAAAGTASAETSINDDSISVGAQANAGEGSLTLGTSGSKRDDGSDSDLDQTFRFGLSQGVGAAGRVHFGDADKDGNPEIGVGADFGFVSFDVKSEDPLRTGLGLLNASQGPIGLLPSTFGPGGTLDDENLTKKVVDPKEGVDAGRDLGGAGKELLNEAKDTLVDGVSGLLSGDDD
ncbi:MAG: hypothetical protein ABI520_15940 [Caldimonas sp.]